MLLNGCYTARLFPALAGAAEWIIGTKAEVQDKVAIDFAKGFYQAIAAGREVPEAFSLGRGMARDVSELYCIERRRN